MDLFKITALFFGPLGVRQRSPLHAITPTSFLVHRLSQAGILLVGLSAVAQGQQGAAVDARLKQAAELAAKGGAENLSKSFWIYRGLAADGNAKAMRELGNCYDKGKGGVSQNSEKALEYFGRAVTGGDTRAMFYLGSFYERHSEISQNLKQAVNWYEKAALAGDSFAMVNLGTLLEKGSRVPRNLARAVELYEKAASAGNARAMNNLGELYMAGNGVNKNDSKGAEWFEKGATLGDPIAMYNVGICYDTGKGVHRDPALAMTWLEKSAKAEWGPANKAVNERKQAAAAAKAAAAAQKAQAAAKVVAKRQGANAAIAGNDGAIYTIGVLLETGHGAKWAPQLKEAAELMAKGGGENSSRAFRLYEEAALAGNADAMNETGKCYFQGTGVAKDERKGLRWFELGASGGSTKAMNNLRETAQLLQKAATDGDTPSMRNLGYSYARGLGVIQNGKQAVYWLEKAAESGDTVAMTNLGVVYERGVPIIREGAELAEVSQMQFIAEILYKLGPALQAQTGSVGKDYRKAAEWYEKAAKAGDASAMDHLGGLYHNGNGVSRDYRQAAVWYRKAIKAGDAPAMNHLGVLFDEGNGVDKDFGKAAAWFAKGAGAGDRIAMYNLGICYAYGKGVPADKTLGLQWLEKSNKAGYALADAMIDEIKFPGRASRDKAYRERKAKEEAERADRRARGLPF